MYLGFWHGLLSIFGLFVLVPSLSGFMFRFQCSWTWLAYPILTSRPNFQTYNKYLSPLHAVCNTQFQLGQLGRLIQMRSPARQELLVPIPPGLVLDP